MSILVDFIGVLDFFGFYRFYVDFMRFLWILGRLYWIYVDFMRFLWILGRSKSRWDSWKSPPQAAIFMNPNAILIEIDKKRSRIHKNRVHEYSYLLNFYPLSPQGFIKIYFFSILTPSPPWIFQNQSGWIFIDRGVLIAKLRFVAKIQKNQKKLSKIVAQPRFLVIFLDFCWTLNAHISRSKKNWETRPIIVESHESQLQNESRYAFYILDREMWRFF